jgi:hypothetical protein
MAFKMAPKAPCLQTTTKYSPASPAKQKSGASGDTLAPGDGVRKTKKISTAGNFEPAGKQKDFIPFAFRPDAKIGGGSNSGIKGKMGSSKRKAEYDAKGWAYDETISKASTNKPKAKTISKASTNRPKAKSIEAKSVGVKNVVNRPKAKTAISEPAEKKAPKLEATKTSAPKKEVKQTRAQRIRAKGEAALASGDKKKALRLRRRLNRVEARKAKKEARKSK